MDIQMMKKESAIPSDDLTMLVSKVWKEIAENGMATTKCPKCGGVPTMTEAENRRILLCPCHYIKDIEIDL